jgi:hypothetical protein
MTTKLNYDNAAALVNAFRQGAKFKVVGSSYDGPVTDIRLAAYTPGCVVVTTRQNMLFKPDGSRHYPSYGGQLIRDESLGYERTSVTVGDSIFGWPGKRGEGAKAVEPAAVPEKPLLQRLLQGETFHVPATRETLVDFKFSKGSLQVTLQPVDGTILDRRVSENYDHNGKHKWVPARSLVAGPVPPKAPVVPKTFRGSELFSTAPEGVYEGSSFHAVVLVHGNSRAVVYADGGAVEALDQSLWASDIFKPTALKAKVTLA